MADWDWRTPKPTSRLQSKHVVLAAFAVVTLIAITGFALYGRGLGDPSCECTGPGQAGWNMGGAVFAIIVIIGFLVLLWRPDLFVSS